MGAFREDWKTGNNHDYDMRMFEWFYTMLLISISTAFGFDLS